MSKRGRMVVTGFSSFPGTPENPTEAMIRRLQADPPVLPCELELQVLPVTYRDSERFAQDLALQTDVLAVICFGVAGARLRVELESLAMNADTSEVPDCADQHRRGPIIRGGPPALAASLPLSALQRALADGGIPAGISDSAGGYVCNHLFYTVMYALHQAERQIPAGFVHVPPHSPGFGEADLDLVARILIHHMADATLGGKTV